MIEIWLERILAFGLFWGIWLMVPLLVDVSTSMVYFINFLFNKNRTVEKKEELSFFPYVTVIIPVHNSADTLDRCLDSIARQTYPLESIQVICINNASEDESFEIFQRFQYQRPEISTTWSSLEWAGKSIALNAGMYSSHGIYVMNVDADTWLEPSAILNVVRDFENDPDLVAATGSIRVDKKLGDGSSFMDMINYCEVVEYIVAFDIGRRYQDQKNTIFTLSGAFSIFRRDTILQSFLYQTRTVSEDTDLTFNIRRAIEDSQGRIGFIPDAIAYVEPIESLGRLFSQRLRWQRGELEVTGVYYKKIPGISKALFDFMLAMIGMYFCYMILEGCTFYIAYKGSAKEEQKDLQKVWWIIPFMPIYRYMTYWFRLGGIIAVLTEERSWKSQNPVLQLRSILQGYENKLKEEFAKRRQVN